MIQDDETDAGAPVTRVDPRAGREPASPSRRPLDAMARARIGRELQRHYAQILALPIPDHLRTLLDDLAERAEWESPR